MRRKLERVDRAIGKAVENGEIPGAVVLARMGDALRYEGVFGAACLSPERHPTRLNTIYDLASLTKVMATTPALLLLVSDGKLSLDQPVVDVLPTFAERAKSEITLRHLLTHSSGLRPWRAYYEDLRERERRRGESLDAGAPLLCNQSRTRISKRRVQFLWRTWQQRAGFDRLYPLHAIRHSAVTNVYRKTRDLFLAQRFARHASPLTTTVYTHPSDEDIARQLRSLSC